MTEPSKRHGLDTNELDAWRQRTRPTFTHDVAQAKVELVRQGADPEWLSLADQCARYVAMTTETFTVDDVWRELDSRAEIINDCEGNAPTTPELRAMGSVMLKLSRAGVIRFTGTWVASARKRNQRQPIRVWERAA